MKSTRTPAGLAHDTDPPPLRSQTVPLPASSSNKSNIEPHSRRVPTSNPTMPTPTTRQRTRSGPRSHPSNVTEAPKMPEPRNTLAGTGYIVEPLAESHSQEEYYDDTTLLAPPRMPIPDVRESTSSFQTEPSSYYTVDENWSTGGPAPQMPDHFATQKKNTYEDLWLAAQTPEIPAPNSTAPPMPSPYENLDDFPHDVHADDYADEWRAAGSYRMPEHNPQSQPEHNPQPQPEHKDTTSSPAPLDRYDSSWLARPSPGMPVPKAASPPMPSSSNAPSEQKPPQSSQTSDPVKTGSSKIPSTAPLRVHHRQRPPSATQASVATSPFGRIPVSQSRPDGHRVEYNRPAGVGSTPLSKPPHEPTPTTLQHVRDEQRPPSAAATTYTQQKPPSSQSFSYEPRPTDSASIVLPSATSHKPYVPIYGNLQSTSAKPQHSTSPLGGKAETRPTAFTPIVPPATPHKVTSVHTQPTTHRVDSTQPTRPTIPPAPTVSPPSAPVKDSNTHTQQSIIRPQVTTEPSRPTISASHPQQYASTSTSKEKEEQQQHADATTTTATPTRPRLRGEPSQLDTQYVNMLLALDDIPSLHNILAGFFNWVLLAGFILFPGTFTSLQNLNVANGQIEQQLLHAVTHLPL